MVSKRTLLSLIVLAAFFCGASFTTAQPRNLLQNSNADQGSQSWRAFGNATVEQVTGNNLCFVVRNGGTFIQDVSLPDDAVGQYALLIGRGASEHINSDGPITGLPYLYGYMMEEGAPNRGVILAYLQGQQMLASTKLEMSGLLCGESFA